MIKKCVTLIMEICSPLMKWELAPNYSITYQREQVTIIISIRYCWNKITKYKYNSDIVCHHPGRRGSHIKSVKFNVIPNLSVHTV